MHDNILCSVLFIANRVVTRQQNGKSRMFFASNSFPSFPHNLWDKPETSDGTAVCSSENWEIINLGS